MATLTAYATTASEDLGPGSNLTVTVGGKQVFLLDSDDQIALQAYLDTATRLPTSDSEMRKLLGYTTDKEGEKFADLIQLYSQIFSRCSDFKTKVFPQSVDIAIGIGNYALKTFTSYDRILKTFQEFSNGIRTKESAREIIGSAINKLRDGIDYHVSAVNTLHAAIQTFDTGTIIDQNRIKVAANFYSTEFNLNADIIKKEEDKVNDLRGKIAALKAEYDQAVILAATTPTYAWIPFVGLIVGATVAGVYGAKAVKLQEEMIALGDELRSIDADLQLRISLKASLNLVNADLAGLGSKCAAALIVLGRIKTVWTNIDAALERFPARLNDINNKETLLGLQLAVEAGNREWEKVYQQAARYVGTAYLRVEEMVV